MDVNAGAMLFLMVGQRGNDIENSSIISGRKRNIYLVVHLDYQSAKESATTPARVYGEISSSPKTTEEVVETTPEEVGG